jgi:hypothetical protein
VAAEIAGGVGMVGDHSVDADRQGDRELGSGVGRKEMVTRVRRDRLT